MDSKAINKRIFDTLVVIEHYVDFIFSLDGEDNVTQFVYNNDIVIDIRYDKVYAPWKDADITYPAYFYLYQKYNPSLKKSNVVYYESHAETLVNANNGITFSHNGRTEWYRNLVNQNKFIIPSFIPYVIHQWFPAFMQFMNPDTNRHCSKETWFMNQKITVYDAFIEDTILAGQPITLSSDESYMIYHQSGIRYSMNRMFYNVKSNISDEQIIRFVVQYPIKLVDYDTAVSNREGQDTIYTFTKENDSLYHCNEIYSIKKGHRIDRNYSIYLDSDGVISMIKYYNASINSDVTEVMKVTRTGRQVKVEHIYDKDIIDTL